MPPSRSKKKKKPKKTKANNRSVEGQQAAGSDVAGVGGSGEHSSKPKRNQDSIQQVTTKSYPKGNLNDMHLKHQQSPIYIYLNNEQQQHKRHN